MECLPFLLAVVFLIVGFNLYILLFLLTVNTFFDIFCLISVNIDKIIFPCRIFILIGNCQSLASEVIITVHFITILCFSLSLLYDGGHQCPCVEIYN